MDFKPHCQLEYGEYVQTHEQHDNSLASRTVGAPALHPTGNAQGGWYFISLSTGRHLNRNKWTRLPMPADVVDRVHVLARRNPLVPVGLVFGNQDGVANPLDDDDEGDDSSYNPNDDESDSSTATPMMTISWMMTIRQM
jgi:hypothetical protein